MEPQTVRALLHWNNTTPRLYVRANPLVPVNGMPASLAPLDRAPGWFSVDGALPLEEIKAGSLYVADPSTRYAIDLLAPRPGEEILDACAALQRSILENASQAVKPGGRLVYSTCSIDAEEDGLVVRDFLQNHPEWTLKEEKLILPHEEKSDGAYAALLICA